MVSKLGSDILSDRIIPTIEQIKSLAASALGQDQTKGAKPKPKVGKEMILANREKGFGRRPF